MAVFGLDVLLALVAWALKRKRFDMRRLDRERVEESSGTERRQGSALQI
jgi:hypothetical protein